MWDPSCGGAGCLSCSAYLHKLEVIQSDITAPLISHTHPHLIFSGHHRAPLSCHGDPTIDARPSTTGNPASLRVQAVLLQAEYFQIVCMVRSAPAKWKKKSQSCPQSRSHMALLPTTTSRRSHSVGSVNALMSSLARVPYGLLLEWTGMALHLLICLIYLCQSNAPDPQQVFECCRCSTEQRRCSWCPTAMYLDNLALSSQMITKVTWEDCKALALGIGAEPGCSFDYMYTRPPLDSSIFR